MQKTYENSVCVLAEKGLSFALKQHTKNIHIQNYSVILTVPFRLEKTFKIITSNCQPDLLSSITKLYPLVPQIWSLSHIQKD